MGRVKITKKIAFIVAALLSGFYTSGQVDTSFHAYYEGAGPFVITSENLVFNSFTYLNSFASPNYVTAVSKNGQSRFRNQVMKHETTVISDMITAFDDHVVYVGYAHGCDYVDTTQVNFISSLDSAGSYVFDLNYKDSSVYTGGFLDGFKQIRQYHDSSFFVINDSCLFHFTDQGVLLSRKRLPLAGGAVAFCFSPGNNIVVSKANYSPRVVYEMDTACNLLTQTPSFYEYKKLVNIGNRYFGLTSTGRLHKLNAGLSVTDSSNLWQAGRTLTDLALAGDTLICSAISGSSLSLFRIDTSFTDTSTWNPDLVNILPQKVVQQGPSMYVLSNEVNGANHNPNINLTEVFKATNTTSIRNDAGVTGIQLDSAYSVLNYMSNPNITQYINYYRMKITVRNFGSVSIPGFRVNHKPNLWLTCGYEYYTNYFTMPLAPGQSTTVTSQFIYEDGGVKPGPPPANYTVTIPSACFWTSVPGRKGDADHTNDEVCAAITYTGTTVGIEPHIDDTYNVKAYPNPFSEEITIEGKNLPYLEIALYSALGELVKRANVVGSYKISIPCSDISQGVYFIQFKSRNGNTGTIKLVK